MAYNLRTGLIGSGDIDVNVSLSGGPSKAVVLAALQRRPAEQSSRWVCVIAIHCRECPADSSFSSVMSASTRSRVPRVKSCRTLSGDAALHDQALRPAFASVSGSPSTTSVCTEYAAAARRYGIRTEIVASLAPMSGQTRPASGCISSSRDCASASPCGSAPCTSPTAAKVPSSHE